MKKLMIVLAAAVMTVAANASTVTWGLSSGALDTEKFASGTAYLFYTSAASLALPDTAGWDAKSSWTQADITSSGATLYGTGTVANGAFTSDAQTITSLDGTTGVKRFYMAVISDDGKNVALVTSTKTARIVAATTGASLLWNTTQFNTFSAATTPPTPDVPEPTSGLLMLVGLGALALRRRRA